MKLVIRVREIRGNYPIYRGDEKIVIEGREINLKETDRICIHALAFLLHYAVVLREGVDPVKLGLAKEGDKAYIQCLDLGKPYTNGERLSLKCQEKGNKPFLSFIHLPYSCTDSNRNQPYHQYFFISYPIQISFVFKHANPKLLE